MSNIVALDTWLGTFWDSFIQAIVDEFVSFNIGEDINHGILQWQGYFQFGGASVIITDAVIVSWIAISVMVIILIAFSSKKSMVPDKKQTVVELAVGLIVDGCMSFGMNRKEAEYVTPMVGTFGSVIMACNICSVFKLPPPAKNIAFPITLGFFAIAYVIYASIKLVGVKGFFKSMVHPMPAMLPFKVLDFIIKPVSLSLRLFGNIFGAFVFMEFLYIICPIVLTGVFGLWFDLADGMLQAVVFSYLTMSYIGEIVEIAHSEEGKPRKKHNRKEKKIKAVLDRKQESVAVN